MSEMINLQEFTKLINSYKENSGGEPNLTSNIPKTNSNGLSGFKIVLGVVVLGIIGYEVYELFFKPSKRDKNKYS
jgi:hypothetical protein